jgi:hypothetical protein
MSPNTHAYQRLQWLYRQLLLRLAAGAAGHRGSSGVAQFGMEELPRRLLFSFTPLGGEFAVNAVTTGNSQTAVVASDGSGAFVVVWQANNPATVGWDIYAQRYNSSGVAQGGNLLVNQTTTGDQTLPAVAMESNGSFAIAWMSNQGSETNIYARIFSAGGAALTNELNISNVTSGLEAGAPAIAMDASGNFVVAYDVQGGAATNQGIYTQSFSANGAAIDSAKFDYEPSSPASNPQGAQIDPAVAMDSAGDYVVAWTSQSGAQPKIYGQLYSAGGIAEGLPFLAGTTNNYDEADATVGMDANGNFTIAWSEQIPGSNSWDILARQFNASGTALLTTPIAVNTFAEGAQQQPSLAELADGQFAVAWESNSEDGSGEGIYAQVFSAAGTADGGQFQVNSTTQYTQEAPHIAWNATNAIVAWDGQTATSSEGIAAQRFTASTAVDQTPTVTVPGARSTNEDTALTFSSTGGNAITVADPDGSTGTEQVTLTATHGTVTLATLANLSVVTGTGTNDTTVTIQGQLSDLNVALNGLTFTPTAGFSGSASLAVSIDDMGNSGSGGPLAASKSVAITVSAVADTPAVTDAVTNENRQTTTGLVITSSSNPLGLDEFQITNITGGTLYQNNGTTQVTNGEFISTAQADAGLKFTPTSNSTATGSFGVQTSTLLGIGGLSGSVAPASVTVKPVPVLTIPTAQATPEDTPLSLSSAGGNAIVVSDPGAPSGTATVTLAATGGTISLPNDSLVVLNSGTGVGDATVSFTGTLSALNTALSGLVFTPASHTYGSASIAVGVAEGSNTASGSVAITVDRVAHTPTDTNAVTNENSQSTSGLVITPNILDTGISGYFQITGITNGTLYLNNGTTQIANGQFITFAQGETGLKFTPTANSTATGSFAVQASKTNAAGGLGGTTAVANVTVKGVPVLSLPGPLTTNEDQPIVLDNNAISVSDPGASNATVTVSLSATGGAVSLVPNEFVTINSGTGSNDAAVSFTGSISAVNLALDGMTFTPSTHSYGSAGIAVTATEGTNTASGSVALTVNRIAHTSSVTGATTLENQQTTSGLVITPNALDANVAGYFQITGIAGGTLYQDDGVTPINDGDFITFAQGHAGLLFTPAANSPADGSFTIQAALSATDAGLGGSMATATIAVHAPPVVTLDSATLVYTQSQPAQSIDPSLTVTDPKSNTLAGATVDVVGNVSGEDALAFSNQNGITGAFDASNGILALSGTATLANYQAALRSITYTDTSDDPTTTTRSLSVTVADGMLSSTTVSRPLQVVAVNTLPLVSVSDDQQTLENGPLILSTDSGNGIGVSDVDANGGVEQISLSVSGGTVTLAPQNAVQITAGGVANDTLVTFTGTLPQLNAALDGLTFIPALNFSGEAVIAVTADDLGNTGTGGPQSTVQTLGISVIRTAHTPTVTDATTVENTQSSAGLVITPNALDSDLAGYYQISAISGGILYQSDGVTRIDDGQFITFADGAAGLRFTPDVDSAAGGSFSVGAATAADSQTIGGASTNAAITVTALPLTVKSAAAKAFSESETPIGPAELQVVRADGSAPQVAYQVASLPQFGMLRLGNTDLEVGSTFSSADVIHGRLQYVSESASATQDAFIFTASDAEGAILGPETLSISLGGSPVTPRALIVPASSETVVIPVIPASDVPASDPSPPAPTSSKGGSSDGPAHPTPLLPPAPASSGGNGSGGAPAGAALNVALTAAVESGLKQSAVRVLQPDYQQHTAQPTEQASSPDSVKLLEHVFHTDKGRVDDIVALDPQSRLWNDLDSMREKMSGNSSMRVWAGTATVFSIGLPVVYIAYAVRTGTFLSSLMSSIPSWSIVDPLPILNQMSDDDDSLLGNEEEDKDLHDLVEKNSDETMDINP